MHPLVRGAAAAAVFTALGSFDRIPPDPAPSAAPKAAVHGVEGLPAPCVSGTLPEGPVCLRIPRDNEALSMGALPPNPRAEAPLLLEGRALAPSRGEPIAERIPRRPERPADSAAYVYPVGEPGRPPRVLGGSNSPGVRLAVRPGERVVLVGLEQQAGPAEVIFAGDLFGRTVVTAHTVDEGPRKRTYLLFHGGLDRAAPGVVPGARLEPGADLGFARMGSASTPGGIGAGLIDVYVEVREVRDGATLAPADARRLVDTAVGIPTDVRNVLPLRAQP